MSAASWKATPEWREFARSLHGKWTVPGREPWWDADVERVGHAAVAADRRLLREQIEALKLDGLDEWSDADDAAWNRALDAVLELLG